MTTNRYGASPVVPRRRKRRTLVRKIFNLRNLLVAAVVFGVVMFFQNRSDEPKNTSSSGVKVSTNKSTRLQKGTPTFTTYLPEGKHIKDYGGWTRISPAKNDPVYAYADTIGKAQIIVSQQDLPASFQGDVDAKVQELADGYSASQTITADDITIHIGKSADGPESIIFNLDSTLILIKTDKPISNDALLAYIESLR